MTVILVILLLVCLVLLVYAWIIYPPLLRLAAGRKSRRRLVEQTLADRPGSGSMAILLAAHNEEKVIRARLDNLLECTADLAMPFSIHVGVDGAQDRTAMIVCEFAERDPRIHLHNFHERRGKMAVLKDLYRRVVEPSEGVPAILVFTDANTRFEQTTLRSLLAPLADPTVGGVCGRLIFHARSGIRTEEECYWQRETGFKIMESQLDSCLGANGAVYAIRTGLFWRSIPDKTLVDDFVLGMKVREQGFRMYYEPAAVAHEDLPPRVVDEWRRRVRIGTGAFQALWLCRHCLAPRYGWFAWMFWSHKVLRWFTPHLILSVFLGAWMLVLDRRACECDSWIQVGGAATILGGVAAFFLSALDRRVRYFFTMQAALFCGFLRFCGGRLAGTWQRTER